MNIYLSLILIVLIIGIPYCVIQIRHGVRRQTIKQRLKDSALLGVNPRGHRKVLYETVSLRKQRLAWLTAANRASVEEGIKEYGNLFGVDNSTPYVDTFGIRNSIDRDSAVIRVIHKIRQGFSFALDHCRRYIKTINSRTRVAIQSLSTVSTKPFRSLVRPNITTKGESEDDNNTNKNS